MEVLQVYVCVRVHVYVCVQVGYRTAYIFMIPVLICTVYLLQYQFLYLWFAVAGNSTDSQEIQVQQRSGICLDREDLCDDEV